MAQPAYSRFPIYKWFKTVLFLILLQGLFEQYIHAQQNESLYVKIDYFAPLPGTEHEYVELERSIWKPLHRERKARGIIRSWNFYQVVAAEANAPYRYITVNVFDDFDKIDYFDLQSIMETVFPDSDPDELMEQTVQTRNVVKTEIWRIDGKVLSESERGVTGNYLTINYFDERDGTVDHAEMELDFWGAIHKQRVANDILSSWAMYTLVYPGGDSRMYTYSTIDYYDSLADIQAPVTPLATDAHPDLSQEEIDERFGRTADARSLYKTELWKLIDSVGSQ